MEGCGLALPPNPQSKHYSLFCPRRPVKLTPPCSQEAAPWLPCSEASQQRLIHVEELVRLVGSPRYPLFLLGQLKPHHTELPFALLPSGLRKSDWPHVVHAFLGSGWQEKFHLTRAVCGAAKVLGLIPGIRNCKGGNPTKGLSDTAKMCSGRLFLSWPSKPSRRVSGDSLSWNR